MATVTECTLLAKRVSEGVRVSLYSISSLMALVIACVSAGSSLPEPPVANIGTRQKLKPFPEQSSSAKPPSPSAGVYTISLYKLKIAQNPPLCFLTITSGYSLAVIPKTMEIKETNIKSLFIVQLFLRFIIILSMAVPLFSGMRTRPPFPSNISSTESLFECIYLTWPSCNIINISISSHRWEATPVNVFHDAKIMSQKAFVKYFCKNYLIENQ